MHLSWVQDSPPLGDAAGPTCSADVETEPVYVSSATCTSSLSAAMAEDLEDPFATETAFDQATQSAHLAALATVAATDSAAANVSARASRAPRVGRLHAAAFKLQSCARSRAAYRRHLAQQFATTVSRIWRGHLCRRVHLALRPTSKLLLASRRWAAIGAFHSGASRSAAAAHLLFILRFRSSAVVARLQKRVAGQMLGGDYLTALRQLRAAATHSAVLLVQRRRRALIWLRLIRVHAPRTAVEAVGVHTDGAATLGHCEGGAEPADYPHNHKHYPTAQDDSTGQTVAAIHCRSSLSASPPSLQRASLHVQATATAQACE